MTHLCSARIQPDWAFPGADRASSTASPGRQSNTGWRRRVSTTREHAPVKANTALRKTFHPAFPRRREAPAASATRQVRVPRVGHVAPLQLRLLAEGAGDTTRISPGN